MSSGLYHTQDWVPKSERRTAMPQSDVPVERLDGINAGASEGAATHLYVPKGHEGPTSMQPRYELVPVNDDNVRNLQTVLFTTAADMEMRRRAYKQLTINYVKHGDADALAILKQFHASDLSL